MWAIPVRQTEESGAGSALTTWWVAGSGGVLAGHEPEIGHDLARPLEASPVTDLTDQGQGRQRADAAEALELLDLRAIKVVECDLFDLTIEIGTSSPARYSRVS